ncbi:killer toxin sensitivity protein [Niveomyces insectorum RCEF 264]|uniref:Elongator complex protein 5 n=1 Tax=Niveomyces insectorum RCEF 264 TaxID=1081102 RepID=A0A162LCQ4_9HYPO|nr:killer toxin sensitivity protein [Niveomyces insectorum RCEF 264]
MAATKAHARSSYSVLLLQKLLSLRDGVSPLTLVLDTLQEPGQPIIEEFMLRAKSAGTRVVYVSSYLAHPRRSPHMDVLIERKDASLEAFRDEIISQCPPGPERSSERGRSESSQKTLIVIDSLCQLARQDPLFVAAFVSSLVSPTTSVLGLHHADDPSLSAGVLPSHRDALRQGKPPPLKVLCHLATAVVRVHALHEEVAKKRARDRSTEEPHFGWAAGEGWPFGYGNKAYSKRDLVGPLYDHGVVVDMELRRRSGRAVVERYVMVLGGGPKADQQQQQQQQQQQHQVPQSRSARPPQAQKSAPTPPRLRMPWEADATPCTDITVMSEHPLFAAPSTVGGEEGDGVGDGDGDETADEVPTSSFSLGLTAKQRRDRDNIVLPYFDAQTDIGAGEGGRILYDMGREDDFDEEEDEI